MRSRSGRACRWRHAGAGAVDDLYALSQRIVDRIEATDVNSLTPLQALNLLEELQQELKEKR